MELYQHCLFLLLLLWTVFLQTYAKFLHSIVTKTETDWTAASRECDLEAPLIHYSRKLNTVNVYGVPEIGVWGRDWVGYVSTWTAFEYVGCVNKADLFQTFMPTFLDTRDDPGQCYSACGYSEFFGMLMYECYCLSKNTISVVKNRRQFCNQCLNGLVAPQGPACGSYRNTSNIALYKVNKAVDEHSDIPLYEPPSTKFQVCLGYIPKNESYVWAQCDVRMRIMCKYEDGKIRLRAGRPPWIGSMIKCHENGSYPVTFSDAKFVEKDSRSSWIWTGVVRGQAIYRYNDKLQPVSHVGKMFGYLTKDPLNGFVLKFTSDRLYRALCAKATSYVPNETTGAAVATVTERAYSTFIPFETTAIREAESGSHPEANGVPVYVLVLVTVAFTLVITGLIVVLIWQNRNHKSKFSGDMQVSNVTYANSFNSNANFDRNIGIVSSLNQSAGSQSPGQDNHYEEPISVQATSSFHNYDTPPSSQPTTSRHNEKPNHGNTIGPYESLGQRNTNTS